MGRMEQGPGVRLPGEGERPGEEAGRQRERAQMHRRGPLGWPATRSATAAPQQRKAGQDRHELRPEAAAVPGRWRLADAVDLPSPGGALRALHEQQPPEAIFTEADEGVPEAGGGLELRGAIDRRQRGGVERPHAPRAVVAEEVLAGERAQVRAVDVAADDRAVPVAVAVLVHRQREGGVVARRRGRRVVGDAQAALHHVPAVVAAARVARILDVHLLAQALPDLADPEVTRTAVEAPAVGIPETERPDLVPGRATDERIVGRDAVDLARDRQGPWREGRADVDAQHLAE